MKFSPGKPRQAQAGAPKRSPVPGRGSCCVALIVLSACQITGLEEDLPVPTLPPAGRAAGEDLVAVFNEVCLGQFRDEAGQVRSLEKAGFAVVKVEDAAVLDQTWYLERQSDGMTAEVGEGTNWWHAPDAWGTTYSRTCRIVAELSDPERMPDELAALQAPDGSGIALEFRGADHHEATGEVHMAGGTFGVNFHQAMMDFKSMGGERPEACGGPPKCHSWGETYLIASERLDG